MTLDFYYNCKKNPSEDFKQRGNMLCYTVLKSHLAALGERNLDGKDWV